MDPKKQPAGQPGGKENARKLEALPIQYRSFQVERSAIDREARTVELSFSSETPVEQWWGTEVLGHGKGEIDLSRLASGAAPLLMDHNPRDQIGVIETARVQSGRGVALARFGNSARAQEIFQDVCDGIRSCVSVGYRINELELTKSDKTGDFYRATSWTPYENSLVSIPADDSVGVGRSEESRREFPVTIRKQEAVRMDPKDNPNPAEGERAADTPIIVRQPTGGAHVLGDGERDKLVKEARDGEASRVREIIKTGEQFNCRDFANEHVGKSTSIELFRGLVLERLGSGAQDTLIRSASIGMSDKERRDYSIVRALRSMSDPDPTKKGQGMEFEREITKTLEQRCGREAKGVYMPMDIRAAAVDGRPGVGHNSSRGMTVGTAADGGDLVATDLLTSSFIELLRNRAMVRLMGARFLTGLVGNISIPKQTVGGAMSWTAEAAAPGADTKATLTQVPMSPKEGKAYTDISRKLLLQSSLDVEAFVRADLAMAIALGIDLAAINGSGGSQPTGILNLSGLALVVGGTNGAAATFANMIAMETDVAGSNADVGSLGYLTNSKQRGALKQQPKLGSTFPVFVWEDGQAIFGQGWGLVNGYKAGVSNQVPATLTKGTSAGDCSAIIFGNWNDLIIGQWGELDVLVDPYTNSNSGSVRVNEYQDVDIAARHTESFAAMVDAL